MTWPHTGVILTGGASSRMGSDKASLRLSNGRTMAETIASTLNEVCTNVLAAGTPIPGVQHVPDLRQDRGPLAGIETALRSGLDSQYLVCSVDMPLLTPDLLRMLTDPTDRTARYFIVDGESHIHPLPLRIGLDDLEAVTLALDGGRNAIHRLLADLGAVEVTIDAELAKQLANVNTVEDYVRIVKE